MRRQILPLLLAGLRPRVSVWIGRYRVPPASAAGKACRRVASLSIREDVLAIATRHGRRRFAGRKGCVATAGRSGGAVRL